MWPLEIDLVYFYSPYYFFLNLFVAVLEKNNKSIEVLDLDLFKCIQWD